jgi:hypothetical protein
MNRSAQPFPSGARTKAGERFDAEEARCQQVVLAHQAKHQAQRGLYASLAQPRPHLAVALAMELAGGEPGLDRWV